jgi:hypothetical protein
VIICCLYAKKKKIIIIYIHGSAELFSYIVLEFLRLVIFHLLKYNELTGRIVRVLNFRNVK